MALAAQVSADVNATKVKPNYGNSQNCDQRYLCNGETNTGVCQNAGNTDEISFGLFNRSNLTFSALQSAGAYDCDVFWSERGHDDSSGVGVRLWDTDTQLAPATPAISVNGGILGYVWANCTAVGTQATVVMLSCPAGQ